MTWQQSVEAATQRLEVARIDDARTNAEYLASHVQGLQERSAWRAKRLDEIAEDDAKSFEQLTDRRIAREPLQYILGEWEFFGLPMIVRSGVLIPRPETEVLVEEALREAKAMRDDVVVVDGGTGSGAIALAIACRLPKASVIGYDVSEAALEIARENKQNLKLTNVEFLHGDMLRDDWLQGVGVVDLLVSNPPYVSVDDFESLEPELRLFEPREALTDNASGLTFYRVLVQHASSHLASNGRLIIELGYNVSQQVQDIAEQSGLSVLRVVKDLAGIERVLVAARQD
jgi:release factor glutamine methyltransferase